MKHIEDTFPGHGSLPLYYQGWLPDSEPKAVLLIVHGLAEHSGRYMNAVNYFVPRGYAVYAFDHEGHGKSPGLRCHNQRFSDFMNNLDIFLALVKSKHPSHKIFIIGHSMGGTISASFAVTNQQQFDGLILSAATLKVGADIPLPLFLLAKVLSKIAPETGLYTIDAAALSRDKSVMERYLQDPLVYTGKIRARPGVEFLKTVKALQKRFPEIELPVLILQGTGDKLSDPEGSFLLFRNVGSQDRTMKVYEDFYHELFNETERERVFSDIEQWLEKRC